MHHLIAETCGEVPAGSDSEAVPQTACQACNELRLLDSVAELTDALRPPAKQPMPDKTTLLSSLLGRIGLVADSMLGTPEAASMPLGRLCTLGETPASSSGQLHSWSKSRVPSATAV